MVKPDFIFSFDVNEGGLNSLYRSMNAEVSADCLFEHHWIEEFSLGRS